MPELPEVETVRRGLEAALEGATIREAALRRGDLRQPFPRDFARMLAGRRIESVGRRAKYLLFHLDSGDVVIAHLGMTGRFSVGHAPKRFSAHDHVTWHLADGRMLIYNDVRRFGLMTLARRDALYTHALLRDLGPEPFDKAFSAAYLKKALSTRTSSIKAALMDQALVVGVGNIYASEALFLTGIRPQRKACDAAPHSAGMIRAIRRVLNAAIASGGSSLRDFIHVSGDSGYFQHAFNVYDREGEACVRCNSPIKSIRLSGRSSFYCPCCQK